MRLAKSLALAAALAATSAPAIAGGLQAVVVEPVVVEPAPAPRSSWGMILPIALLVGLIALAVSSDDDDDEDVDA